MSSWWRRFLATIRGERRQVPRLNSERVAITNRQYAAALQLARRTGGTPDELIDYHRADRILGGR